MNLGLLQKYLLLRLLKCILLRILIRLLWHIANLFGLEVWSGAGLFVLVYLICWCVYSITSRFGPSFDKLSRYTGHQELLTLSFARVIASLSNIFVDIII